MESSESITHFSHIKAPNDPTHSGLSVFLAGSIEQGKAEDWQTVVSDIIRQNSNDIGNCIVFNPRRDDWDDTWEQTITNDKFREQVNWEIDRIDKCDVVYMYFDGDTKSPITLLELGYVCQFIKPVIIYCPDNFWRRGNIEVIASRYDNIFLTNNKELSINVLVNWMIDTNGK